MATPFNGKSGIQSYRLYVKSEFIPNTLFQIATELRRNQIKFHTW